MSVVQPVLLRRTASNVPPPETSRNSSDGERPINLSAPGSGGVVYPRDNNLVIADEEPGDYYDNMTATHKRKTSGLPLEAEAIYNRASVKTSMEQITDADEEEGNDNLDDTSSQASDSSYAGGGGVGYYWSAKIKHFMTTPRGMLILALVSLFLTYVVTRDPTTSSSKSLVGGALVPSSAAAESAAAVPRNPDSKGTTNGEFHEESVGTPMEHHTHKYNNILFYDSPDKMKPMRSKGPRIVDEDVGGGLYVFEDVCLTNNIEQLRYRPQDTSLRGLLYFSEKYADNNQRCVPCSNAEPLGGWNDMDGEDAKVVGHSCGMPGLHAMFATSVGDWTDCIMEEGNAMKMEEWHQTQSPVNVTTIHFFQKPVFLLQFNAVDMEKSLFDMLLTYLPHWQKFFNGSEEDNKDGFPFDGVISHSTPGCLSHSHNWFCEVLHQMTAFGHAKEIPWESDLDGDENTLYCYTELYYNQLGYQRDLDHEGLVTRETFLEFRELLFRKFGLPRRPTLEDRLADAETEKLYDQAGHKNKVVDKDGNANANEDVTSDSDNTKIIFYDNKLGDTTIWNEMDSLISKARELEKFQNIKFVTINDVFADMSVAQQAKKFNEADAIIMAHGKHMANAIFSVDGTSFVEVGCKVDSLISNARFMDLVDGNYFAIESCTKNNDGEENGSAEVCVICAEGHGDDMLADFVMTPEAFEKLIDDVVASLG